MIFVCRRLPRVAASGRDCFTCKELHPSPDDGVESFALRQPVDLFGEIGARVFAAAFCNGTGIARGAAFGKALAELATGRDSPTIDILQRRPAPTRTLPRPLLKLGVGLTTRYRLWRAGAET